MSHIFLIHSSVIGDLGCFHILATVNSSVINTGVHVSFQIMRGARLTGVNSFRLQFRCFRTAFESPDDG